jgi:hypothetical protein
MNPTPGLVNGQTFSISEAARFFDRSVPWLRWRESTPGLFVREDGSPIEVQRTVPRRAAAGYRRYTVNDIGDIADALWREKKISGTEYRAVKARVEAFRA